jgi:hypothetical protein
MRVFIAVLVLIFSLQSWAKADDISDFEIDRAGHESLRVEVFTSEYCSFCQDALEIAKSAAYRITYLGCPIEVVETSVDDDTTLIEDLNLLALPLIQVGDFQLIGLPQQEDIERLIHETILMK